MVEYDCPIFTLFVQLPTEIRLRIWKAALPGPRVINIREKRPPGKTKDEEDDNEKPSDSKNPSMLFVCRESREVALKFYTPRFALKQAPETYFDFNVDALYLRFDEYTIAVDDDVESTDWWGNPIDPNDDVDVRFDNFILALHDVADFRQAQRLALFLNWEETNYHEQLAQVLGWFGHIRELIVVVGHFNRELDNHGDIVFYEPLDVTKTCYNYENFSLERPYDKTPDVPLAMDFVSTIDLGKELEKWRHMHRNLLKEDLKDLGLDECEDRSIPIPQIEYKLVVTNALEQHLEGLRKGFQQKRKEEQ